MTDRPESLAAALAELQQHLPRIGKDAQAQYGKYADLADCTRALLPILGAAGFSWTCRPTMMSDGFRLVYMLSHAPSGEDLQGFYPLPATGTPQQIGSAITYARRYCLLAVTGAAPDEDDDDAQAAEQAARAQRRADPETRADGSATDAELSRMNYGHEPGAARFYRAPPDEYEWQDQPAPAEAPEDRPGSSVKAQRQGIYIALSKRGIKDFKSAIERLTGRDIAEPADMSYNEAIMVKARVDSWDGRTEELLSPFVAERSGASG